MGVGQQNLKTNYQKGGIFMVSKRLPFVINKSPIGGHFSNDIALIILDNQVHWNPSIQPACLPAKNHDTENHHQHQ